MNTGLLFPGQGSQKPGMLHDLVRHRAVEESLQEMSDILGQDVRTLDSEEALRSPVAVQLALLAAGAGTARALIDSGLEPVAVAGLSVGAFSAAVAAGAISLRDAVHLVGSRAEQMEKLYPTGYGLAAIVGLNDRKPPSSSPASTAKSVQCLWPTSTLQDKSSSRAKSKACVRFFVWHSNRARGKRSFCRWQRCPIACFCSPSPTRYAHNFNP